MLISRCLSSLVLSAAVYPVCVFAGAQVTRPLNIGGEKQLLIDNLFFDESENIQLRLHPARKTGEHNIVRDRRWESATLNWFSFLEHGGKCRMWYECYDVEGWPTTDDTSFCYAESTDGIHWTKPDLGLFTYRGDESTNILFRQIGPEGARSRVHGTCVFIDPSAPAESRYKAISQGMFPAPPNYRVAGMHSPDGLHWTRYSQPICDLFADSQYSAFWDQSRQEYAIFGRVSDRGRALGRSASQDFTHFPELSLVLAANDNDPPDSDVYNPAAIKYAYAENVYFMFPSLFQHKTQTLDIRLAVSRDGINWTYPEQDKAFIPLGAVGEFDSGSLYMGQGIIRHENELSLYYGGSRLRHDQSELENLTAVGGSRIYSRVVVPLDRFVSASASVQGGYFITPPIIFEGNALMLNTEVHGNGYVRVAVLNSDGQPIEHFSLEECRPLANNPSAQRVEWKAGADLSAYAGKSIRLHIELFDASLYSLQFQESPPVG